MAVSIEYWSLVALSVASATVWYTLAYVHILKQRANEPPLVGSVIPYIGHILGLLWHGTRYFEIIRYVNCITKGTN